MHAHRTVQLMATLFLHMGMTHQLKSLVSRPWQQILLKDFEEHVHILHCEVSCGSPSNGGRASANMHGPPSHRWDQHPLHCNVSSQSSKSKA